MVEALKKQATAITESLLKQRMDKRYVVLSIDGGGVRGLMSVEILVYIEELLSQKLGKEVKISDVVDLVIGTSAGGLTALAIAYGLSAKELKKTMLDIIKSTFAPDQKRGWLRQLRHSAFDTAKLEEQLIKYIEADKLTMGDLRRRNPNIRAAVTAMLYDGKSTKGKFTPFVFDSENPDDADRTLMSVARATSAAPMYFDAAEMKDGALFYDGATFACNPSAWGLVLAATKVKIESIMLISVGTGNPDMPPPSKISDDQGFFESAVSRLNDYYKDTKKFLLTKAGILDDGSEKKGIVDWINVELVASLYLDCQKQNEQVLNMLKPCMGSNYWRLNPRTESKIDMAKAGDKEIATL